MALPLLIGAAAAPILGGVIGNLASAGDREAAMNALKNAQEILAGVRVPTPEELQVTYQTLQQQGMLSPEMEEGLQQAASQMGGISVDQGLKDAQKQALSSLAQLGRTGLNAEDRAALMQIRNQLAQQQHGADESVLQNMAARGMGGSGVELAARLAAGQNAMQSAEQAGSNLAAQAQARALQAISQQGGLASQLRQQEFGEKSDIAKAQDVINQFNIANQQNVASRNIAAKNAAAAANLGEKQRISDVNTQLTNQAQQQNKQNIKDIFGMQMQRAGAVAGAAQPIANQYGQQAAATAGMWSGIGSGVGQGFSGVQQQNNYQSLLDAYKAKKA